MNLDAHEDDCNDELMKQASVLANICTIAASKQKDEELSNCFSELGGETKKHCCFDN